MLFRMERETDRLWLRPTRMSDAPALFSFLGDAAAMRHTHSFADLRACRRHLAAHEWQRRRRGYAPWTLVEKAGQAIIGWGEGRPHPAAFRAGAREIPLHSAVRRVVRLTATAGHLAQGLGFASPLAVLRS